MEAVESTTYVIVEKTAEGLKKIEANVSSLVDALMFQIFASSKDVEVEILTEDAWLAIPDEIKVS